MHYFLVVGACPSSRTSRYAAAAAGVEGAGDQVTIHISACLFYRVIKSCNASQVDHDPRSEPYNGLWSWDSGPSIRTSVFVDLPAATCHCDNVIIIIMILFDFCGMYGITMLTFADDQALKTNTPSFRGVRRVKVR